MKKTGTILMFVFFAAGCATSFSVGDYMSDKSHMESRAEQFDRYISFAIDTVEDKGLSVEGSPEAIVSNLWVAHELCDDPEISSELSNLWNILVYEKDVFAGQEYMLTTQLKVILER